MNEEIDGLSFSILSLIAGTIMIALSGCGGDAGSEGLTATSSVNTIIPSPTPSATPSPSATPAWSGYSGTGVLAHPYLLSTPDDVVHIGDYPAAYFSLTQNIDMVGVPLTPIPNFTGVIQGHLHKFDHVTIASSGANAAAFILFLGAAGTVTQLYMSNVNISSAAGFATTFVSEVQGTLTGCHALSGVITSPAGGNGQSTGVGNPVWTTRDAGSVVNTNQSDVTFNGHAFFGTF
jgi:hypothetical protein